VYDRVYENISHHIVNYLKTRFAPPTLQKWGFNHFEVEMRKEDLENILRRAGLHPPGRVLHTHTTSSHYKELLEQMGFKVDAFDISALQASAAGGKVANAERIFEFSRGKYDGALLFEPAELFHGSGNIFGSVALIHSLLRAVKPGRPAVILAQDFVTGGGPSDNFEAVFRWMQKHFGIRVERVLRDPNAPVEEDVHYVTDKNTNQQNRVVAFKISADEDALKRLEAFVKRFDEIAARHVRKSATPLFGDELPRRIYDEFARSKLPTVAGEKEARFLLEDYIRMYKQHMKTF